MKYIARILLAALLCGLTTKMSAQTIIGVTLSRMEVTVAVGDTAVLIPAFRPASVKTAAVKWVATNPKICTIEDGVITGVAVGQASIRVIAPGGASNICMVKVVEAVEEETMEETFEETTATEEVPTYEEEEDTPVYEEEGDTPVYEEEEEDPVYEEEEETPTDEEEETPATEEETPTVKRPVLDGTITPRRPVGTVGGKVVRQGTTTSTSTGSKGSGRVDHPTGKKQYMDEEDDTEASTPRLPSRGGTIKRSATKDTEVFTVVEEEPSFPKEHGSMSEWLNSHIQYPKAAQENGVSGRVICEFIVETTGELSNVKVVKSVDPFLDQEALRVVKSMPKWKPGKTRGKAVRVKYTLPVIFRLTSSK